MGASFSTVSAIDLLRDGETKSVLLEARKALETGELEECAINCRKALYLEVEKHYDISKYKDGDPPGLFGGFTEAPYYARSKQYVDEHVLEPTDFIAYDHNSINQKLLIMGADNTAYWNVWRLTPEVFKSEDGQWVVKQDFRKLDKKVLSDKIDYIFSATLDLMLSIDRTQRATKWLDHRNYYLDLTQEDVPVYKKADKNSELAGRTPPGMTRIDTDFRIDGLNGDGPYWSVSHIDLEKKFFLFGFIHNDFVK